MGYNYISSGLQLKKFAFISVTVCSCLWDCIMWQKWLTFEKTAFLPQGRLFLTDLFCYLVYSPLLPCISSKHLVGLKEGDCGLELLNWLCYKSGWIVLNPQHNIGQLNGPLKCEKGNILIS